MRKFFRRIFNRNKSKDLRVIGTLRIPYRYKEGLESIGDVLNLYITASSGIFYLIGDPDIDDRYSSRYVVKNYDQRKTLFGASWEWSKSEFSSVYELIIPGKFVDGVMLSAYKLNENQIPYPGMVIIEII